MKNSKIDNSEIIYQSNGITLINNNDELCFIKDDNKYNILSHPHEPCLYIKKENKIITTIHNAFNVYEIIDVARGKYKINAISGMEYNINDICKLLCCAINSNIYETDISYFEKQFKNKSISNFTNSVEKKELKSEDNFFKKNDIKELIDDQFYEEYKKYDACVLDYCILKINDKYNMEKSHKEAVIYAMEKWKQIAKEEYDIDIYYETEKMKFKKLNTQDFFEKKSNKDNKPYCKLFLNPPYGSNYRMEDFIKINNILFPNGYDNLEICDWSTDWSNYFDDGLEWWGARCVSIYDKSLDRFVIIGASATD